MKLMRVADYIAGFLAQQGVRDIFLVTGGGAMHLNDAIGRCQGLRYICCHHEQACAMAAEGYSRATDRVGVINVTSGPGGINALNGVFGAWTDSIPMLVLSGQVKRETCMAARRISGLRQLGDQEADICSLVAGITKYAVMIEEPLSIRYHLERAWHLTTAGRPGPCWIDVPVDVQAAQIDVTQLRSYDPEEDALPPARQNLDEVCAEIVARIRAAKRPVLMVGKGVRCAGMEAALVALLRRLRIPVVTAWTGIDLLPTDDPLFCGRPGDIGDRAGNFTVQNADLLLVLGTRLGLRQVSYNWHSFARAAFKIQVDIDAAELSKPTVRIDLPVHADLRVFLPGLLAAAGAVREDDTTHATWLAWCKERQRRYPVLQPHHMTIDGEGRINPYFFLSRLFRLLRPEDIVVCANGAANVMGYQTAVVQPGQRMFCNTGNASMGYGLPAAIGAAAGSRRRVICLEGDGSLMMNLQELQTVAMHRWPIKILVLDNGGYLSIRKSQQTFFDRLTGESAATGVAFPDFPVVADAMGVPACTLAGSDFEEDVRTFLASPGPGLARVLLDPQQGFEPKLAARSLPDGRIVSPALEDMHPFLSREELAQNLLIPEWEPTRG
jgi:acetolactate synthase-1/2/3 large subunit